MIDVGTALAQRESKKKKNCYFTIFGFHSTCLITKLIMHELLNNKLIIFPGSIDTAADLEPLNYFHDEENHSIITEKLAVVNYSFWID